MIDFDHAFSCKPCPSNVIAKAAFVVLSSVPLLAVM